MGLRAKFNLIFLVTFAAGIALASYIFWGIVQRDAQDAVIHDARIIMAQANNVIDYTAKEVSPLLTGQQKLRFLPQSVPFFASEASLRKLASDFPDYRYKVAALDPTNPKDRAADWESAIIDVFRRNPSLTEYVSTRETAGGSILSLAHPVRIDNKACLTCHSTPEAAPAAMVDLYGRSNGFGWTLGTVEGAKIVSVPTQVARSHAFHVFLIFLGWLTAVFAVILVLMNLLLHFVIIRPVRHIAAVAGDVSMGNVDAPEIQTRRQDEIGSLAQSFNRMRRSLVNAMRLLEG